MGARVTNDETQFAAMDEIAEWAVQHAKELAALGRTVDLDAIKASGANSSAVSHRLLQAHARHVQIDLLKRLLRDDH
jgi:hypothetical protein